MMTVNDVYQLVASTMLERGGFQLGLISVQQFLSYYTVVLEDFISQTGLTKTFDVEPMQFGIDLYGYPDSFGEPDEVFASGVALQESSDTDVANSNMRWLNRIKTPRLWFQSTATIKDLYLFPAPQINGNQVRTSPPFPGFYGTISSVTAGADITITAARPLFGTISLESGSAALIPAGPILGTISDLETGQSNILSIGTALPFDQTPSLTSLVEQLPDTFVFYVVYGVLEKIYSCDGETKDEVKRRYCSARYQEGIMLGKAVMSEEVSKDDHKSAA